MIEIELKSKISDVIKSLNYYEKGFSSTKRTPVGDKERSTSLSQYIECRLNFEFFKIPFLKKYEECMDGHLFKVTSIEGEEGRKFQHVTIQIESRPEFVTEVEYNSLVNSIHDEIGGNVIKFNSSWKKPKIEITSTLNIIENEEED